MRLGECGGDSLLTYAVERRVSFVQPPAVLVSIDTGVRTINKPDNQISLHVDLREVWVCPHHLDVVAVVAFGTMTEIRFLCHAASWKELSGKLQRGGDDAYCISTRRLSSTASLTGNPKCSSSAMMREMRSSTLFVTGATSCGFVCIRFQEGRSETNFAVGVNSGNGPQDGF
jgi:hypothetical protein